VKVLIRLYKEARRYWKYIAFSTVSLLIITAANLIAPGLMQKLIGILEKGVGNQNFVADIIKLAILLALVYLVQSLSRYFNSYYSHVAAWRFVSEIRVKIYSHLQKLSLSFYSDKQTGQLMSRIVHDTNHFEHLIAHAIPELLGALLTFAGVTTVIFLNNWKLALLTCIPLPFLMLS
jgi:ABC-type multidrug transport system fused ATPase/permease subunit